MNTEEIDLGRDHNLICKKGSKEFHIYYNIHIVDIETERII